MEEGRIHAAHEFRQATSPPRVLSFIVFGQQPPPCLLHMLCKEQRKGTVAEAPLSQDLLLFADACCHLPALSLGTKTTGSFRSKILDDTRAGR